MKVSYSRVSSYLDCPQKHYFSYVEKLKSNKPARPLSFGGDFHKCLQVGRDPKAIDETYKEIVSCYEELSPYFKQELGDSYLDDILVIHQDYLKVYKNTEQPVLTEHEFLIPIGKLRGEEITFHGFIDEVYDNLVMGEHKTFTTAPSMDLLAMNMQPCLYAKAWELETGDKFQRVRWNYIKSTPAEQPIWLEKSQRFSDAASQKITPYSYLRACYDRMIPREEALAKAKNYKQNISNFFFRCDVELLPVMVDTVWDSFKNIVRDIATKGDTNKIKRIGRDCSWCDYRPLCYGEFTGADVDYIKKTDFVVKE